MTRRPARWLCALAACTLAVPCAAEGPPAKKLLTVDDLYLFDGPQSAVLAPDGKSAVSSRHWIADQKDLRYSLWKADGSRDRAHPLEDGEPDGRAPVFSPDGKW